MSTDKFESIQIGDSAEIKHTITAQDVADFVSLTGDDNPLHVDDGYAASTSFKKPVVHGMLTASYISTLIGTKLPGEGALWYEQSLRFLAPVRPGEGITVTGTVRHKSAVARALVIAIKVVDDHNRTVIEGDVKVKLLANSDSDPYAEVPASQWDGQSKPAGATATGEASKAVVVSGGSRGIGAAIARQLASQGHPVILSYCHSRESAEGVVAAIADSGGQAAAVQADARDRAQVEALIAECVTRFGGLGGLVHCAAAPIKDVSPEDVQWADIQEQIDIQLKGAYHAVQASLPHLQKSGRGSIVTIGSTVTDNLPPAQWLPYNTAKAALWSMTKTWAAAYGKNGIRVNCVSPGMTDTEMIADLPEKAKMVVKMTTPLRRLATAQDIAQTVQFLMSDNAAHITGQNIRVCGGAIMQ